MNSYTPMLGPHRRMSDVERNTLFLSRFAHQDITGFASTFTDATARMGYADIVTAATNLAATYPATVALDTIATLASGNKIMALRIRDDGSLPVALISNAIHGDERDGTAGLLAVAEEFAKDASTNAIINEARGKISLCVIITTNPDGMASPAISEFGGTGTRENGAGVNLNRNWPWFWDYSSDTDKGSAAASEAETSALQSWLLASGRVKRVAVVMDVHGWNSKTTWGFLTEQIYHAQAGQQSTRNAYLLTQEIMRKREWTGFTLVNGTPVLTEYRSRMKPYLYTWVRNNAPMHATGYIVEYPQTENTGVVATAFLDITLGVIAAAVDSSYAPRVCGHSVTPALSIVNNNSFFTGWNDAENRPDWFSYKRSQVQRRNVDSITIAPDATQKLPTAVQNSAYTDLSGYCLIAGGKASSGTTSLCYRETPSSGIETLTALPVATQYAAACNDGSEMCWVYGGIDAAVAYQAGLYRRSLTGLGGWTSLGNVTLAGSPLAIQRHTMHYYGGKLYIVGGRTSAAISTAVYQVDPVTLVATQVATLPAATQRHASAVHGNFLYIFGGDAGVTVRATIYRVDLTTFAVTTLAAVLPAARERQIRIPAGASTYLAAGTDVVSPTLAADYKSNMYLFDSVTETVSSVTYTVENYIDDLGNDIPAQALNVCGGLGYYRSVDGVLVFAGGEYLGAEQKTVWEMDENNMTITCRESPNNLPAYIRSTQAFTITTGEKYVWLADVASMQTVNDTIGPHCTALMVIGPLNNPNRVVDTMRSVPSRHGTVFSMPVIVRAGETEMRAYGRFWNSGQKVLFKALQLLKVTDGKAAAAFAPIRANQAAVTRTVAFPSSVTSGGSSTVSGLFSPYWGSKQAVNQEVMAFTVTGLENLVLWFSATDSDLEAVNGAFELRYGATTYTFPTVELNHARTSMEWRRDNVHWRMSGIPGGVRFSLWFYGRVMSHDILTDGVAVSGYTLNGCGILDYGLTT